MKWNIGLIGFGNVGKAFIKLYQKMYSYWKEKYDLEAEFYFVLNSRGGIYNKKGIKLEYLLKASEEGNISNIPGWQNSLNFENINDLSQINLLVEVSPSNIKDGEPALSYIAKALSKRISVVTGNKGPFVHKYKELMNLAKENNLLLGLGCTAAAALPSINFGLFDLTGCKIYKIEGILNGVCNFILTHMEENNISLDEALNKAISLGIAETNPSYDIDGLDTAVKTIIIANSLMNLGITINDIKIEGIRNVSNEKIMELKSKQKRLKLIGYIRREDNAVDAGVKLIEVNKSDPLWYVNETKKALLYSTEPAGEFLITGGASSPEGAAYSLWRDIINYKSLINNMGVGEKDERNKIRKDRNKS